MRNSEGGYAVCNQIHGTGKRAQTLFHFAHRPNWSFNRTSTSFAGNRPLTLALGSRFSFLHLLARFQAKELQRFLFFQCRFLCSSRVAHSGQAQR